jgi:hypothetical protein
MAKRKGAKATEIEAGHLALISHPDAVTDLILEALAVWDKLHRLLQANAATGSSS